MDNKPNFGERVQVMRGAAKQLREIAELVATEVIHMEAAAQRFQQRADKRGRRNMPAPTR
jgi:hypothetical protein